MKKTISIITPCFNEEENIMDCYTKVKEVFNTLPDYNYEHLFIDNHSTDKTVEILKQIAKEDKNIKIIVNIKNFGHVRSSFYGIIQTSGDAIIGLSADLQDPPSLIPEFVKHWEKGYKLVLAIKVKSKENKIMFGIRTAFYNLMSKISETEQIKNCTGFGLYDKQIIDVFRQLDDPYPYFRGLLAEFSPERYEVPYQQPIRKKGNTKYNLYSLYDYAMLGFVNNSKLPLRLASFIGFTVALVNLLVAFGYLIYKLIYWNNFQVGVAPLVIGIFFFAGVQLFFLGIIGEYIGAIYTQIRKRPFVVEKERINF